MAARPKPKTAPAADDGEMCVEHFPDGFDHPALAGQTAAACEHGAWTRGTLDETTDETEE